MQEDYRYLDLEQFRSLYRCLQNPQKMKFFIEGIKCSKCIDKIESIKLQSSDIKNIDVNLSNQTAEVELRSAHLPFAQVASEISRLGFRPIPILSAEDSEDNWRLEAKKDLIRIGVAGFCAGNIMMFSFAIYFGLHGPMKTYFEYLQFALYLPVLTYVTWPFYKGFISGLKQRSLSIDGPMAIASFIGFAVSSWNLFRGTGSIYLDSTSGFLFLILTTRYFQKSTRYKYLKFLRPTSLAESMKARLKTENSWKWVRSDSLKPEDVLIIKQGDWLPADGFLVSEQATVDLSVLDGESMPRRLQRGGSVRAGSRLLSEEIEIRVTKSGTDSFLGKLLSSVAIPSISETESSHISNLASQVLLVIVLSIAALVLISGFFYDFESQFERAFALIVLACPCAMAFGTPLAFSFSMKRAQEKGIIIKSAKVFESLANVNDIFLDKTGTITDKHWSIVNSSHKDADNYFKQLILCLEAASQHPIAYALRDNWSEVQIPGNFKLEDLKDLPSGVSGIINGTPYKFYSYIEQSEKWFGLFQNEKPIWKFQMKSALQNEAKQVVDNLRALGKKIFLVSGDSVEATQAVAQELQICPSMTHAQLTPEMKEALIKSNPNSLMIGDGVNDTLALNAATVGIAVKGGVDIALKSADVLFLNNSISSLPELFHIADIARKQIRRNLIIALIYNTLGGFAALLGFINPFVAALLMPVSSLFILLSTWWGTRK